MAGTRKLTIEILGDAKGLSGAFSEAEKKADGFGSKLGTVAKGAGVALGGIGIAAIAMAPDILETGGKLEALGKKAKTVFEDSLGSVEAWAATNAKAMGLTNKEAVGAAAGIADLLKPMGFSADAAAGMSTKMLDLSGALSAWTGGQQSAAEVSDVITKAMLGETDGLKSLGISIGAADIQARLAEKGQDKLTGAALAQAQALATQELIMEKSTDAQKAWTDGSMDSLKAQNTQKASLDTLKETLITSLYPALQALVPILTTVAEWLGTNLPIAIEKVKAWFEENWPKIHDAVVPVLQKIQDFIVGFIGFVQGAWDTFGATIVQYAKDHFESVAKVISGVFEVIQGVFQLFKDILTGKWGALWDDILGIFTGIKDIIVGAIAGIWADIQFAVGIAWDGVKATVGGAIDSIVGFVTGIPGRIAGTIDTLWEGIKTGITTAKQWVSDEIDKVVGFALNLPNRMWGIFTGMWDGIKDAFKSAINTIIGWWNNLDFTFPGFDIPGPGPNIPGFTIGMPDIPRLHSGGTVNFGSAGEGLALLRNNETVLTPEQGSMRGGITVVVYGTIIQERDAVRMITDGIIDAQSRGEIPVGAFS
jgi:hypothetical protein